MTAMRSAEPRRWLAALVVATGLVGALAVVVGQWAWQAPAPVTAALPQPRPPGTVKPVAVATPTNTWRMTLWQPLRDAPPPPPAKRVQRPPTFTLFAVTERDGTQQAVIDHPDHGLLYLAAGQQRHGIQVTAVDADTVTVHWDDRSLTLELP